MLPVLIEHNKIIGLILDIKIDDYGIYFILGVWEEIKEINYFLSIGFKANKYIIENNIRYIKEIDIKEISLVEFPAQEGTYAKRDNYK